MNNPLSQEIVRLSALNPQSKWVVFQDGVIANLPRMLGVPSLGGVMWPPQTDFWQSHFGQPHNVPVEVVNRYAHVVFTYCDSKEATFSLESPDAFKVCTNPDSSDLAAAGVDYVIFVGPNEMMSNSQTFTRVFSYRDKHIYARRKL